METITLPWWKQAPFTRLLPPFISGIVFRWYWPVPAWLTATLLLVSGTGLLIFSVLQLSARFRFHRVSGGFIHVLLLGIGIWVVQIHTPAPAFPEETAHPFSGIATLRAPLAEKTHTWQTTATISRMAGGQQPAAVPEKVILYFPKDSLAASLHHGDRLVLRKQLQPIRNLGNPAGFDYRRYCAGHQLRYQAYLQPGDWQPLHQNTRSWLVQLMDHTRTSVITSLRRYIPDSTAAGLAEALLIGYRNDLDSELRQSFARTGVIHIIAISGLHLGIVYWLLSLVFKPLTRHRNTRWLAPFLTIAGLWFFSLLAGGTPSVLRAAVMFSFIVIGQHLHRPVSVYNSLAASAFLLLCYNPFWLWDVGFQLSYTAVLSIVLFTKPVYGLFFFRYRLPDRIWKLLSITLAAQVLTAPLTIYYFHQLPLLFPLTNLIAIPLATLILFGGLLLCATAFIPAIAAVTGWCLYYLIHGLTGYISQINRLPFASWSHLSISLVQLVCLWLFLAGLAIAWLQKKRQGIWMGLAGLLCFACLRTTDFYQASRQQQIIVYNVPHHRAIDFISGRDYIFRGDRLLEKAGPLRRSYLEPARIRYRLRPAPTAPLVQYHQLCRFANQQVLLIDRTPELPAVIHKIHIDLVILSHNPPLLIAELTRVFDCGRIIMDASNSRTRIRQWQADCKKMQVPYFSIPDSGAFVMPVN